MSKDEAQGWGFGTALGFLLAVILVWSWPPPKSEAEDHKQTDSSPYGISTQYEVPKTFREWGAYIREKTEEDPVALYTFVLTIFTGLLGVATIALWVTTRSAEANKRSIILGAGTIRREELGKPHIFSIEASNAGECAAVINTIQWGFIEFRDLSGSEGPRYTREQATNEAIHPKTRAQIVRFVVVPPLDHPVIFFRLNYSDVNRWLRASVSHVMDLANPELLGVPIFVEAPAAYSIDTFPPLEGR